MFKIDGPLLIAANHPNSFLDAIILATLFKKPVYSLTRGDVFAGKFYKKVLSSLHMLPVYRLTEGAENLGHNYTTFSLCKEIFKKNGIVLIFSEGQCINEWHLRSLKKGTARLAISAWQDQIPLKILPLGLNYSSFLTFGKNLQLNFGNIICEEDFSGGNSHGRSISQFNDKLQAQLNELVIEIDKKDKAAIEAKFVVAQPLWKKIFLFIPAIAGWLFHFALYLPLKKYCLKKMAHIDHYDSVLIGSLFILYPVYLLLLSTLLYLLTRNYFSFFLIALLPFCAWSYVQVKHQFEKN